MGGRPTVFVVDDDAAVRDSLTWLIKSAGLPVETYDSGWAFLAHYRRDRPGCLVLDLRMPGMSGLELQEKLARQEISLPVIIITGHGDVPTAVRAMRTGAMDLLQKPFDGEVLLKSIREALDRDARNRREWARWADAADRLALLTPREQGVLGLILAGKRNREAAAELGVSSKTVEAHRGHIMRKMGVRSLAELVRVARLAATGSPASMGATGGETPGY